METINPFYVGAWIFKLIVGHFFKVSRKAFKIKMTHLSPNHHLIHSFFAAQSAIIWWVDEIQGFLSFFSIFLTISCSFQSVLTQKVRNSQKWCRKWNMSGCSYLFYLVNEEIKSGKIEDDFLKDFLRTSYSTVFPH